MVYTQVRFTVEDIAIWKPVFEEAAMLRKSFGSLSAHAFSKADNPNEIMVLLRFESQEQATQMFQSPEFRAVTQRGKMLAPPEVTFFNEVETLGS